MNWQKKITMPLFCDQVDENKIENGDDNCVDDNKDEEDDKNDDNYENNKRVWWLGGR